MAFPDPFALQKKRFGEQVSLAKRDNRFRLPALLDATRIYTTNDASSLGAEEVAAYRSLVDAEVYLHLTRRLDEIIKIIRAHIHKKELDRAARYLSDMRMLGEFVREKNLTFDFEFYDKIEAFFAKCREDFSAEVPVYSSSPRED